MNLIGFQTPTPLYSFKTTIYILPSGTEHSLWTSFKQPWTSGESSLRRVWLVKLFYMLIFPWRFLQACHGNGGMASLWTQFSLSCDMFLPVWKGFGQSAPWFL